MDKVASMLLAILFSSVGVAQSPPIPTAASSQREVQGQTIISKELPAAELTFAKEFRYVGGQRVNLYGNADAEQYLFVSDENGGMVRSFCWVQFEHFLPSNTRTYGYAFNRTVEIGSLQFIYDVKSFPDYAAMQAEDPASDGAAIGKLLAQHSLAFPQKAARVRMIHLPTADRRTELMIIYGESLPDNSEVPVKREGVVLDDASPTSAKMLLNHARQAFTIRKH